MIRWMWLLSGAALCTSILAFGADFPTFAEVKGANQPSEGVLLDRNGELLSELRLNKKERALKWTAIGEVSPALIQSLIETEDKRFASHHGVDWVAMASASFHSVLGGPKRGASTITMQLVSLLKILPKKTKHRSLWEKLQQTRLALELERSWSKDEILEAYFNLVSFRGEIRGIRAASRSLFGKNPGGIDDKEAFLLTALIRSPNAKAAEITGAIRAIKGDIWGDFAEHALNALHPIQAERNLSPHLAQILLHKGESQIITTLDGHLQQLAIETVREQVSSLRAQNLSDAAVLVVENRTGAVLAYVGSSAGFSTASEVDGVRAMRQAGSSLKPFLYGLAWEKNILNPHSPLLDEPFEITYANGTYHPENYDHQYHGMVEAQVALASSINIPAVRVLNLLGVDAFRDRLASLGFSDLLEAESYGPSLALGTADVSLWDLVNAYRTLANEGQYSELRLRPSASAGTKRRVYTVEASRMVASAISNSQNRLLGFGWDNILSTPYASAVKTGTSKDMRDNWCVGFTKEFTVGVWVGNFTGTPMQNVSGVSGAAPIWRAL
ncbi:MAG: penicillin-binding protein 1C, partial [Bdellovibrionota bacterium]